MKVEDIKNGYCTQFLLHKNEDASVTKLRAFLESNGDSWWSSRTRTWPTAMCIPPTPA